MEWRCVLLESSAGQRAPVCYGYATFGKEGQGKRDDRHQDLHAVQPLAVAIRAVQHMRKDPHHVPTTVYQPYTLNLSLSDWSIA